MTLSFTSTANIAPTEHPANQSDYLANLATIESTEPSDEAVTRAGRLIDRTPYVSVAFAAMAAALQEIDPDAAQIALDAAARIAELEAATI